LITAALLGWRRRPRRRSRSAFLNKALNDVVQSQEFLDRMAALGMTVPKDNTPEHLADYMRRESKHQGELAALTGIQMASPPK
jgi:tripartite-type tricarboxylate transporter receptor subunit TctC